MRRAAGDGEGRWLLGGAQKLYIIEYTIGYYDGAQKYTTLQNPSYAIDILLRRAIKRLRRNIWTMLLYTIIYL